MWDAFAQLSMKTATYALACDYTHCPGPPGAFRPSRCLAFSIADRFCVVRAYGREGAEPSFAAGSGSGSLAGRALLCG